MNVDLANKVALVTGSSRGIGRAIADGLERAGARVWYHGTTADARANHLAADFTRPEEIDRLIATLTKREQRLDILVNNAGVEPIMPIGSIDFAKFDQCVAVNVRAAVQLTQGLLPLLRVAGASVGAGGASVINITSIHDATPYPHNAVYSMSKAALAMFTKTAAIELAPFGIRVNNLAPGAIETDINREVIEQTGRDKFAEWIPAGRVGTVDEVVGPALFLSSDASSYVTGTTLYADGGYRHNLVRYRPTP
jgi:NAD(P)-dependent dehydrogenase (short-subunit alcohol dehydrogenase family)